MSAALIAAIVVGAILPIVVGVAIVYLRIKSLRTREQPQAEAQAARFGLGLLGGAGGALIVCGVVIGAVLLLRAWLDR